MKTYVIEIEGGSTIIGIPSGSVLSIALSDGKKYVAQVEKIHAAMACWHQKDHPTGKRKRRRLLTSSTQMKGWRDDSR